MAGNSKSVENSHQVMREKYGPDFQSTIGAIGGRARGRGYFGRLKDEGRTDEIKELARRAAEKTNGRSKTAKRLSAKKGWQTRISKRRAVSDRPLRESER